MKKLLTLASIGSLLTGCMSSSQTHNRFSINYQSITNQLPAKVLQSLLPPSAPVVIVSQLDKRMEESRRLMQKGYVPIGAAGFEQIASPAESDLVLQALRVGADVVLYLQYSYTEKGVRQETTFSQPTISKTQIYSGSHGSAPYGSHLGTLQTESSGTSKTDYVPYEKKVRSHEAWFWRRRRPDIFGVTANSIPESLRSSLKRNAGAVVEIVMDDSPAFKANIVHGDVIIQIGEHSVSSPEVLMDVLPQYAGQKVSVKVIREHQTMDVGVELAQER